VEEYTSEFEAIQFQVSMHNPGYDELFFASHFVKGLKEEVRASVHSQAPETVNRASFLAKIQQQLLAQKKARSLKYTSSVKGSSTAVKWDGATASASSGLSKECQLRDFRRANGLCYFCDDKFDNAHLEKCTKPPKSQLHAMVVNDLDVDLTEEKLKQLEIEDELANTLC